ncbi:MAG: hypothetical protein HG425_004900 [Propionibacterium sp.]|jgi:hypothetical protein|nr:hypothetical protein [Propionibacterium sp.]
MSSYVTNIMIQAALEDLKGNPEAVHSGASQMQTTGNQLNDAARAVDKLVSSTDEVTSDAFKALGEKGIVATEKLRAAGLRYQGMAKALHEFANVLEEEQQVGRRAAPQAQSALARRDHAEQQHKTAVLRAMNSDPGQQRQACEDGNRAAVAYKNADADFQTSLKQLMVAISKVKEANERAAAKIEQISDDSGLEDSWWDRCKSIFSKIWNGICKVAQWVWEHLDEICLVLEIASFVLAFVPGLAPALQLVSKALRVVNFLTKCKTAFDITVSVGKAIIDPSQKNISGAFKTVGGAALKKFAGKKIDKIAGKIGSKPGAYVARLTRSSEKISPGLKKFLPAAAGWGTFKAADKGIKWAAKTGIGVASDTVTGLFVPKNSAKVHRPQPLGAGGGFTDGGGGGGGSAW